MAAHEHQQVEQRHVVEVAGVQPADRHLEEVAGDLRADARGLEVLADASGASHSAAFAAVHGASSGTCFDSRSIFHCARAIVATASGLIFGISPL